MKWFGENWGAPICELTEQVERPSVPCYMCLRVFGEESRGLVLPCTGSLGDVVPIITHEDGSYEVACHRECFCQAVLPDFEPAEVDEDPLEDDNYYRTLEKELTELERTNPAVRAAREDLERVKEEILSERKDAN